MRVLFFLICLIFICRESFAEGQCSVLFGGHGESSTTSLGRQVFAKDFKLLDDMLAHVQGLNLDQQVNSLVQNDGRRIFFQLRILAQTYSSHDANFFDPKIKLFKKFEFLLGRIDLNAKLEQRMTKLEEPTVAQRFADQKSQAIADFEHALKKIGVKDNPRKSFQKIANEFETYSSWPTREEDRKFLLVEAIDFLRNLNDKIAQNKFDQEDLEKGLHRLRRRLREFIYRVYNWGGFVEMVDDHTLSPSLQKWYDEANLKNPNLKNNAFLPKSPEGQAAIRVEIKLESILNQIVSELGDLKVPNESLVYIEKALDESSETAETKARIEEKLKTLRDRRVDPRDAANDYQKRIRATALLDELISYLKKQL